VSADSDWRIEAHLDVPSTVHALERIRGRLRGPDVVGDAGAAVSEEVVVTHDGNVLFAYAPTKAAIEDARRAIEEVLRSDEVTATVNVGRWDEHVDEWVQVEPPLAGPAKHAAEARERAVEQVESRTLVAVVGRLIGGEVEQTMRDGAERLGLGCEIHEHPHLLSSQVAFTVTGPRRKLDEFAEDLRQEEIATIRTQREVLLSPL